MNDFEAWKGLSVRKVCECGEPIAIHNSNRGVTECHECLNKTRESKMKKRKEYLAVVRISADYDDELIGNEGTYTADDVRWTMINFLEDLGLVVEHIDVVEDRAWGGVK